MTNARSTKTATKTKKPRTATPPDAPVAVTTPVRDPSIVEAVRVALHLGADASDETVFAALTKLHLDATPSIAKPADEWSLDEQPIRADERALERRLLRRTRVSAFNRKSEMSIGDLVTCMFDDSTGQRAGAGILDTVAMELEQLRQILDYQEQDGDEIGGDGMSYEALSATLTKIQQLAEFGGELARRVDGARAPVGVAAERTAAVAAEIRAQIASPRGCAEDVPQLTEWADRLEGKVSP